MNNFKEIEERKKKIVEEYKEAVKVLKEIEGSTPSSYFNNKDFEIRKLPDGKTYKVMKWQTDKAGNLYIKLENNSDSVIFDCLVCKTEIAYSGLSLVNAYRLKCPNCGETYLWVRAFNRIIKFSPEESKP